MAPKRKKSRRDKTTSQARCLCSLDPLPEEGYTRAAQRKLAGGNRLFPSRLALRREELISYRATVVDRMSISGVQEKVSLRLKRGRLELTDRDGEYILKPVPSLELPRFREDVPANEHITMLLAERVFGIETPPNACIRLADGHLAYLTKRFDRRDGLKVPQEDFCQLMERSPETHGKNFKYDSSYEEVGRTLKKFCGPYRIEVERLFTRIAFCYAFSNGDAHLKNFSLLQTGTTGDYVLTPAYDLVCTSIHVPDEARLALELFADDFETPFSRDHGFLTGACLLELAKRFEIPEPRARGLLAPFVEGPRSEVEGLIGRSFLTAGAKEDYVKRYRDRLKALRVGIEA